ncbi:MAG: ORF6N domain-containing protein [Elusimicrobiota bacterium]|jgi:hypothetical protein
MNKDIEAVELGQKIYLIRGQKVMLDYDLAELYGVSTWNLTRAVQRNPQRFPEDFSFQLRAAETLNLTRQFGGSSSKSSGGWGGRRRPPYAFTEQGVAMLSSVLRSERAVLVNVSIMRAFVRLRDILSLHKELAAQLRELERKVVGHDARIMEIFAVIKRLMAEPRKAAPKIGFKPN